ncbi:GntR family transcriptional regulator [Chroococcidiopsis sp. CCALA 051]|nr:GntR family transcriptional regulator [Chroococcidiopsidales cyanobacterium LEGE 13417]PSM50966.1 GntR family transcriptional regulator [Chroococcidiopsis sp. CCALA 051]
MVELRHSNLAIVAKSLDIQAAEAIREQILSGGFPPGSRLLEIPLSEQLNLSRGTIRSALQQLTYEGLVVQIPYKGCAVLELSSQDAWELYTLRSALEGLAAKLAAAAMTADKAEILNSSLKQLIEATKSDRRGKVADADFALHQAIVQLSEHQRLQQQYQIVGQQIRLYIASCNTLIPDVEEIIEQHRLLIEAICSGNTAIAERIAKEHNVDGEELIKHLEKIEIKNF